jgi:hypothetical protein
MPVSEGALIDGRGAINLELKGYDAWRSCVRRLLDWTDGEREDWPELYASGHTPRDVARAVLAGESGGH